MTAVRFRPEVVDDLESASEWYRARGDGLDAAFLSAVEECAERITETPLIFPVVHRGLRRALLERFPFAVFFLDEGPEVVVVAVLHVRRDLSALRARHSR